MRAKSMIVIGLILACFAQVTAVAAKSQPFLHLRLEGPVTPVSATDFWLRIALENAGARCHPIYVDPLFSPFDLPHRASRLAIHVYDEAGNKIQAQSGYPPNVVRLTPDRLLLLDCGAFYGYVVELGKPSMWSINLKPGRYRVRAELRLESHRIAYEERGFVNALGRLYGGDADEALVDTVVQSNEISFTISAPQK